MGAYGASEYLTDTLGGYRATQAAVAPAGFAQAVSADGAVGRVVTAVSVDADSARFLSYTWPNDSGAVYDVAVSDTTIAGLPAAAQALVDAGYVITACGRDMTTGVLLVGTRVHAASAQHSLIVGRSSTSGCRSPTDLPVGPDNGPVMLTCIRNILPVPLGVIVNVRRPTNRPNGSPPVHSMRDGASNAVTRMGTDRSAPLPSFTRATMRAPDDMVPVMAMISGFQS